MRTFFAAALTLHALIHLLGPAKAFGLVELPQLTRPISHAMGFVWLAAAVLFLAAAVSIFTWPRGWWALGLLAVVVSQGAIVASWSGAKFGTALNLVVLVGVVFGLLVQGPIGLRAEYEADVDRGLERLSSTAPVTEADLVRLPDVVQRYLRNAGVVGMPRVQNLRARMHGRIRSGPDAPWMAFTAEQYNFFDQPSRLFFMDASKGMFPIQGFHRYVGPMATIRVKVAGLVSVVEADGEDMTLAETVTMLNDMVLLAPATLIDPAIAWDPVDPCTARAVFTNAALTVRATLEFNDAGDLVNFWSDDRRQASADGKTMKQLRWSTPLKEYRAFDTVRLMTRGEGRWHEPAGEYAYIEIALDDVHYNVRRR